MYISLPFKRDFPYITPKETQINVIRYAIESESINTEETKRYHITNFGAFFSFQQIFEAAEF